MLDQRQLGVTVKMVEQRPQILIVIFLYGIAEFIRADGKRKQNDRRGRGNESEHGDPLQEYECFRRLFYLSESSRAQAYSKGGRTAGCSSTEVKRTEGSHEGEEYVAVRPVDNVRYSRRLCPAGG
jgi:hypothetical protein